MIEIIYKDESRGSEESSGRFHIPRNIRQIGLGGGKNRIYVEDYVYTFMNRIAEKAEGENGSLAILMGGAEWNEGVTYIFVKGAIYLEEPVNSEHISLENESWKKVQEIGEQYFSELDVVGWFLTIPNISMEVTEHIGKTHLKYFSGGEKVLMMMDPQEKDEAFFYYENGRFIKSPGYYLYYEKNQKMQEYMTDYKWWETSENEKVIPDEAVKNFRKKFSGKTEPKEERGERPSIFSYAATACLVIAIVATGANFIRNYQQIQMEEEELEASAVFTVDDQIQVSLTPAAEKVSTEKVKEENKESSENAKEDGQIEKKTEMEVGEEVVVNETDVEVSGEEGMDVASETEETEKQKNTDINEEEESSVSGENVSDEDVEKQSAKEVNESNIDSAEDETENSVNEEEEQETSGKSVLETYMIRPGDTLYQISILNYGNMEAIKEICRMNNISEEEKIYPGQIIVLP